MILITRMVAFWKIIKYSLTIIPYRSHKIEITVPEKMIGNGSPFLIFKEI